LDGRFPDLKHMVRLRGRVVGQEQQQVRRKSMSMRRRHRTRSPSHSHGAVAVSQDQREACVLGDNEGRMGPVGHGHDQEDNHPDPRKRSQRGGQAARRCPAVSPPSPLMGIASHAISSANRVVRLKPIRSAALALPTGSPPGKREPSCAVPNRGRRLTGGRVKVVGCHGTGCQAKGHVPACFRGIFELRLPPVGPIIVAGKPRGKSTAPSGLFP
jgi:hypothetical protein